MSALVTRLGAAQRTAPVLQIAALVILFTYGATTIAGFSSEQSVRSMLVIAALLGLASAGQTLCLIIGALDLSIPGMILVGAIIVSRLTGESGWPFLAAFLVVLVICALVGGTVGWMCHRFSISPIVVTLGVSSLAIGTMQVWTGGDLVGTPPQFLSDLVEPNSTTFGLDVAPVVLIWALFAIIMAVILQRTRGGRNMYATGANPRAARFALVRTRRVWTAVFMASAVFSGVVGVLLAGFAGTDPAFGDPYLFEGLTAVVVGGVAFTGSRGDYTHTAIGALLLTVLTTILIGKGFDPADQQIIFGALILVVVAGYGRQRRLRDRV